jgi:hypothetical protein
MKRTMIAVLMAFVFGLFSMPALQAAPAGNGWALGSALKAVSPFEKVQWRWRRRRRRRSCWTVHYRRSRGRTRCR